MTECIWWLGSYTSNVNMLYLRHLAFQDMRQAERDAGQPFEYLLYLREDNVFLSSPAKTGGLPGARLSLAPDTPLSQRRVLGGGRKEEERRGKKEESVGSRHSSRLSWFSDT